MVFSRTRRVLAATAVLALVLAFAPLSAVRAFPFFSAEALHAPASLWARAWSFVAQRWTKEAGSIDRDGSTKEGNSIDPNGSTQEGGSIDPNGSTEEGGGISPDGSTEEGSSISPDGQPELLCIAGAGMGYRRCIFLVPDFRP